MNGATKKILSMLASLMLIATFVVMPVSAETIRRDAGEPEPNAAQQDSADMTVVYPSIEGQTQSVVESGGSPGRAMELTELEDIPKIDKVRPLQGNDTIESIAAGLYRVPARSRSINTSDATTQIKIALDDRNDELVTLTKLAEGTNCVVYYDMRLKSDNGNEFDVGSTAAQELADEMDAIFSNLGSYMGIPFYKPGWANKVKLVVADLYKNDNNGYTGGYFSPSDYGSNGNDDCILYIDMDAYGYQNYWSKDKMSVFGTMAHEYQHLVNYCALLQAAAANNNQVRFVPTASADDDYNFLGGGTAVSIWLNEGLSGLAETNYTGKVNANHLEYFLKNTGTYVPTYRQWYNSNIQTVVSYYGAGAMLMNTFYQHKSAGIRDIMNSVLIGYNGSRVTVGTAYSGNAEDPNDYYRDFNEFFTAAVLGFAVDNTKSAELPAGAKNYFYQAVDNVWKERLSGSSFAGVNSLPLNTNITANPGGKQYYSMLYLSDAIGTGNNIAEVTVPNDGAQYFLIYPAKDINVDTDQKWVDTGKMAVDLPNGQTKSVTIGTNNRFAVLRVNTTSTNSGTFSAKVTSGATLSVGLTSAPTGLIVGNTAGASVSVKATGMTLPAGTQLTFKVIDSAGADAAGYTAQTAAANANGEATATLAVPASAGAGAYRVYVSDATGVYYGTSDAFYISPKVTLDTPADGSTVDPSSVYTSGIILDFGAGVMSTGEGAITLGYSGSTYTATLEAGETAANKSTIPLGSFTNSDGTIMLGYSSAVKVSLNVGTYKMDDGTAVLAQSDFGSFETGGEPEGPSVLPSSLTLAKDEIGNIGVYFGSNGRANSATVEISDTSKVVLVSGSDITASGSIISVKGVAKGTATLTVIFDDGTEKTVGINVTSGGAYTPTPVPTPQGGGGGGGGSGGGKSGSGAVRPAYAPMPVTKADAQAAATTAINSAKSSGSAVAYIKFVNASVIPLDALQAIAEQAKAAGITARIVADAVVNNTVMARLTIAPELATQDINVATYVDASSTSSTTNVMGKWFSNKMAAVKFDQQNTFGQKLNVTVKVDLTGMDTSSLVFYSYNRQANTYKRILDVKYSIDANGYLLFTTDLADEVVISQGVLQKK